MATTSIWRVKGWLGKVVVYAENPDKTDNPKFFEKQSMTGSETQGLSDVIDYAVNDEKTKNKDAILDDEAVPIMERFVSGVNCLPENARTEMLKTKKQFGKEGGVVAYHGYQSFAPGESTPEQAHEIGVKLAKKLWGEKYQVLVTTHLDKAHHLHNHFVVNTVSCVDGIRYHRTEQDYYYMQKESDALCREYGLSVIEEPKRGKSKHYSEWQAEKEGKPTYRSTMKNDIDTAIRQSMTDKQLWDNLRKMGYHINFEKDITLRAIGKKSGLKLYRNFGEDYTIEAIRRRILAQSRPERRIIPADPPPKKVNFVGTFHKTHRMTGLRALYFYYLYKMGVLPKKREPNPKQVYFVFREDIRHMQNISREARLLAAHGIDTDVQLAAYKDGVNARIDALSGQRKQLRNKTRGITDTDALASLKSEITALSGQIGELRREVRLCEDIERRSGVIQDKLHRVREDELAEKSNVKEVRNNDQFRRRR